jgi:hypothetical protein
MWEINLGDLLLNFMKLTFSTVAYSPYIDYNDKYCTVVNSDKTVVKQ